MWSECVNVSEIKEKTNCSKERMLIGEATSQQIKSGIKKNSFVWENKGQITQDHKKIFYGLI